jgi:hypothetical protein
VGVWINLQAFLGSPYPDTSPFSLPKTLPSFKRTCTRRTRYSDRYLGAFKAGNVSAPCFFSPIGWDWVHLVLRPLFGLLHQPQMINDNCGGVGGMRIGRGNRSTQKTCSSANLSTTNPAWPDLGSNPGRRVGKPTTNRLSYGTAFLAPIKMSLSLTPPPATSASLRLLLLLAGFKGYLPLRSTLILFEGYVRGGTEYEVTAKRWQAMCFRVPTFRIIVSAGSITCECIQKASEYSSWVTGHISGGLVGNKIMWRCNGRKMLPVGICSVF